MLSCYTLWVLSVTCPTLLSSSPDISYASPSILASCATILAAYRSPLTFVIVLKRSNSQSIATWAFVSYFQLKRVKG